MTSEVISDLANVFGMAKIIYPPNFSFLQHSHGLHLALKTSWRVDDDDDDDKKGSYRTCVALRAAG